MEDNMTDNLAEKLLKYPTALGRFCIVIINNIYCIPTYVVWMGLLLPLKRLHPDAYYKIEGLLFHWLLAVVSMWSYTAGYDIVEVGDDIEECRMKKTLVIANHQSTADVPLLMANFNAKDGILPNIMWVMDRLFKYTNFGIVSIIHQDFFISSGKKNRDESIEYLKKHIKSSFLKRNRKWMVLFPEGGFLRKRREVSQRYAKKNNLPFLQHVTLPRVGALKAIMDVMVQEARNVSSSSSLNLSSSSSSSISSCEKLPNDFNNYSTNNDNIYDRKSSLDGSLDQNQSSESESITNFKVNNNKKNYDESVDAKTVTVGGKSIFSFKKRKASEKANKEELLSNEMNLENDNNKRTNNEQITCTDDDTTCNSRVNRIEGRKKILPNGNSALNKNFVNLKTSNASTNSSDANFSTNNNKNSTNCLLEYILDITIAYPKAIPLDLPSIVHGIRRPCSTFMLYRLYKVSNIPKESEALTKWLYDRFVEKDELLERFYKTGQFYLDRTMNNGQVIQQDVLRLFLINLFFITSTYFHYQMFTTLYAYCLYLTYGAS